MDANRIHAEKPWITLSRNKLKNIEQTVNATEIASLITIINFSIDNINKGMNANKINEQTKGIFQ